MQESKWLLAGCVVLPCLAGLCEVGPLVRYPYLGSLTTDSVVIAWKLSDPAQQAELEYGVAAEQKRTRARAVAEAKTSIFPVRLEHLRADTVYSYRVLLNGKAVTAGDQFRTAPDERSARYQNFAFAVVGDMGFNRFENGKWVYDGKFEPDPAVNTQVAIAKKVEATQPDLLLSTGDNVYDVGREINYDPQIFCPYQSMMKRIPFYPSLGNHDYYAGTQGRTPLLPEDENAQPFYRNLFLPEHTPNTDPAEAYYSFDYGEVHFVALNTVRPNYIDYRTGSPQLQWLEEDLSRTKKPWKIVYFHYPVYSSIKTAPESLPIRLAEMKNYVEPILVKHGVQLVFNGHTHSYQRSHPVQGVTYVVTGGGGKSADKIVPSPEPWNAITREGYHFVSAKVKGNEIQLDVTFLDGEHDRFTVPVRQP